MKFLLFTLVVFNTAIAVHAMPLTEVFVATEAEAKALGPSDLPISKYPGADIKGVDVVKLEQLLRLVQRSGFDVKAKHFPKIADLSDDGPWILRFSPVLEQFLLDLDDGQIADWGRRWAEIEEFKLDGFSPDDVTDVLRTLVRVARVARDSKKSILLWEAL